MHEVPQRRGFVRFLYTHNPFYLLSAGLVLYGLHASFGAAAGEFDRWLLLASLGGYTLLIAVTAFLVARLGRVWDDARSLMLVLLLLFFAVAVSLDDFCNSQPQVALYLVLAGFLFSAAVTEGMLASLSIRLPALYRGPYYLILALLFGYPLWVSPLITQLGDEAIRWRLLAFPALCSLAFLALIPAARRGARYTARNGTPWRWPLFPWTIFLFLAIAVALRSGMLCVSFDRFPGMESVFGGYFLAPLWLALLALVVEIAGAQRRGAPQAIALLLAPLVLPLAARHAEESSSYWMFYGQVTSTLGSPLWLALLGVIALYAYAWKRRAPLAEAGLGGALLLACWIGPKTYDTATLTEPQWPPLLLLTAVLLWRAMARRSSLRMATAAGFLSACGALLARQTQLAPYAWPLAVHILLVAVLLIGAVMHDPAARFLRKAAALAMAALTITFALAPAALELPEDLRLGYFSAMALLALGYWKASGERWARAAGVVNLAVGASAEGWWLSCLLYREVGPKACVTLLAGCACFVVATGISAAKAGLLARAWRLTVDALRCEIREMAGG